MSIAKQEFTNAGRSMLGRAQAGETLTISKIVVGSGSASVAADLWPLTALVAFEMDVTISAKTDFGDGTLMVEGSFRSDTAPHAFYLHEVGVMAHIGAEADRLYSVANAFADPLDYINPAAPTMQVFKMKLIVDRIPTGNVNVTIGPSENVIGSNIGLATVGAGVYKDAAGNVLNFKRLVARDAVEIVDQTDTVIIGQNILRVDLDLYVPATHPDAPSPSVAFPTIQDALASIANLVIPPAYFVTIHVYSGRIIENVGINITHPNASQIKIVGMDIVSRAVTGTMLVTGAIPNFDVTVNVPNTTGIAVGDLVHLYGTNGASLEAGGYVLATTATTVKIRQRASHYTLTSMAALVGTKLLHWPTQIHTSSTAGIGMFQCRYGIGRIKNFAVRSTQQGVNDGILVWNGDGNIENCATCGLSQSIGNTGGTIFLYPIISACQNFVGLIQAPFAGCILKGPNPVTGWQNAVFSGNTSVGIWTNGGSMYSIDGTYIYCANNPNGITCDAGYFASGALTITTGGLVIVFNNVGCRATLNGALFGANDSINQVLGNIGLDCQAVSGAIVSIPHNTSVAGNYSPANNVLGPSGGYVTVTTP